MASSINASTSGAGGLITTADNTGILNLQTAGTNAVTVDASQNVGIGTTSPTTKLDVVGSGDGEVRIRANGDASLIFSETVSNKNWKLKPSAGDFYWQYSSTAYNSGYSSLMALTTNGNLQFNSGYGSVATAYGCRAWVNFNGTGTVAIRASGNVTSITDNGTGDYTVNFTTAITDANYAPVATLKPSSGASSTNGKVINIRYDTNLSTSSCRFWCNSTGGAEDFDVVSVSIFR